VVGGLLLVYSLLFAEAFIRVLAPQPLMPRYITGTAWGVRGNIPKAVYRHKTPEVDVEYRINADGMRADKEFSRSKPVGVCRIALFGDSFFVGYELDIRDTVAARLEDDLRRSGVNAEVLNFSVSGFGTAEMLRAYTKFAAEFAPDVVVFEWHSSDLADNVRSGLYGVENGELVGGSKAYLPSVALQDRLMQSSVYRMIADNSHLYSFVREKAAVAVKGALADLRRKTIQDENTDAGGSPSDGPLRNEVLLATKILEAASKEVMRRDAALVVAEVPDRIDAVTFRSDWSLLPKDRLRDIAFVSPIEDFNLAAARNERLYYEKGHKHFTPRAAAIEALLISDRIIDGRHLEDCSRLE
jgi:hypothetical protein